MRNRAITAVVWIHKWSSLVCTLALFMLALALLSACLFQFVREIRLATYAIYVPEEYLELPTSPKPAKRNRRKPI